MCGYAVTVYTLAVFYYHNKTHLNVYNTREREGERGERGRERREREREGERGERGREREREGGERGERERGRVCVYEEYKETFACLACLNSM